MSILFIIKIVCKSKDLFNNGYYTHFTFSFNLKTSKNKANKKSKKKNSILLNITKKIF